MTICHLHYKGAPCEDCAALAFLNHVFPPPLNTYDLSRVTAPSVITFKPGVFEHIFDPWETPRVIDTPQELRAECEKRGVESHYLRDSLLWRSRADREW